MIQDLSIFVYSLDILLQLINSSAKLVLLSMDRYQIWTDPLGSSISGINNQHVSLREREGYSRTPEIEFILPLLKAHSCKLFITADFSQ